MMSNLGLLLRTLYHLRGRQLMYQFVRRFKRIPYVEATTSLSSASLNMVLPVAKATCLSNDKFSFINISSSFGGWNDQTKGMLWAYNLNYMDWLGQSGLSLEKKCEWIDRFIIDLKENHIGRDPYPTALRTVNWVKFFSLHPEIRTSEIKLFSVICRIPAAYCFSFIVEAVILTIDLEKSCTHIAFLVMEAVQVIADLLHTLDLLVIAAEIIR